MSPTDRRSFLQGAAGAAVAFSLSPEALARRLAVPSDGPVAIGVVGAGRQGRAILAELVKIEAARVVALCDVDPSRLRSGLRRAKGAKGYADHRAMLREEADLAAVIVATPTHRHREVAVDALAAGKHVYCEAPLASTREDALAIVAAARAAGTVCQAGLLARSNPIYDLARSFYRSGALREDVLMRAQSFQKTSWRTPAPDPALERDRNWRIDPEVTLGLVGELGTHQFDALQWFRGTYPVSVRGGSGLFVYRDGRETPDTEWCEFRFPDGTALQWQGTLGNSYGGTYEVLVGSMASMKLAWTHGWMFKEADAPTQGWEVYANRETFFTDEGITLIADATKLAKQGKLKEGVGLPETPLHYGLVDFLASVTQGTPVRTSAAEGMRASVIAILAHRAITSGETIEIAPELLEAE